MIAARTSAALRAHLGRRAAVGAAPVRMQLGAAARRSYASGATASKGSSDTLWALTAIAVTAPLSYILWHGGQKRLAELKAHADHGHGHDDHHEEPAAETAAAEEEAPAAEEAKEEEQKEEAAEAPKEEAEKEEKKEEEKAEEKEEEKKEEKSESPAQTKSQDKPAEETPSEKKEDAVPAAEEKKE